MSVRIKDANTVHWKRSHCTLSQGSPTGTLARAATLQHSPHAGWNNTGAVRLRFATGTWRGGTVV